MRTLPTHCSQCAVHSHSAVCSVQLMIVHSVHGGLLWTLPYHTIHITEPCKCTVCEVHGAQSFTFHFTNNLFTVCMAACCGPCAETCGLYFSKVPLQTPTIFNPLKLLRDSKNAVGIQNSQQCCCNVAPPGESPVPAASRWGGGEGHYDCLKLYNSDLFLPPYLS